VGRHATLVEVGVELRQRDVCASENHCCADLLAEILVGEAADLVTRAVENVRAERPLVVPFGAVVAVERVGPADQQFALFACGDLVARVVDDK
jgi:hypothetical protein